MIEQTANHMKFFKVIAGILTYKATKKKKMNQTGF